MLIKKVKKRINFLINILCFLILIIILSYLTYYIINVKLMKDDNFIEEAAENIIEENTGIKIDFTPSSKE